MNAADRMLSELPPAVGTALCVLLVVAMVVIGGWG